MQSSIWKIVSAVGIVGIGTLVVLEVQHRLPPAMTAAGDAETPGDLQVLSAESSLTPDTETEFDRLVSGTAPLDSGQGQVISELEREPATAQPSPAEIRAPQLAAVDTTVRRNQLADGMNPFQAVDTNEVKTVSYQQDRFFEDDSASSDPLRSGVPLPQEPVSFPALDEPSAAGAVPAATPRSPANRPDRSPPGNLMFFSDDSGAANSNGGTEPGNQGTTDPPSLAPLPGESSLPGFDDPFSDQPNDPKKFRLDDDRSPLSEPAGPTPRLTEPGNPLSPAVPPDAAGGGESEIDFFSEDPVPPGSVRDPDVPLPKNPLDVNPFGDLPFGDESSQPGRSPAGREPPQINVSQPPLLPSSESAPSFEMDEPSGTSRGNGEPFGRSEPLSRGEIGAGNNQPADDFPPLQQPGRSDGIDNDFPAIDLPFPEPGGASPRDPRLPAATPLRPESGQGQMSNDQQLTEPPDPFDADLPFSPPGDLPLNPPQDLPVGDVPMISDATGTETLRPHVSIRKNAPETASVGVPLDYSIVVTNEGQSAAYDVLIEDQLGRGINLVSTRPTADYDRTNGRLTWQISQLQPAEKQELVVRVTPTDEGTMDGVATVRFKSQVRATTVITAPRLVLDLTGPSEVKLGDEVSFRYVVRNEGSGAARDVILRSVLPLELRHAEGRDLEYEIDLLEPQEEREIQLKVIAAERAIAAVRNTAEVTIAGVAAASAESELRIVAEQLTVERLGPDRRYVGRTAQFQNIITNNTNFEALNAVVLEQVPVGMKFVSAPSGEFNPDTGVITWRLDRIAPGKQVLLDVELLPETSGPMDAIVEVVENAGFRSKARKTVAVEDLHNVSADISRMDGPVAVGEKFTFTITVDNRGTATANEVQLTVQVPAQIRILAAGSREQGITARLGQGNVVVYNSVLKVEPNQQKTYQLVLQGQEPVRNGVVKAQLKYTEMQESLVVSESVTVYSDNL